ncbi:hypothetical protein ACFQ3B_01035 [Stackebrandtia endophytica]|uniref:hypothetical protein n=1 Tax=Stackebrandtia endophytica TaxID=1496996 RepID=UPI00114F1239|nr:hypothetical protein [Stackebrandtia endophytica]
MTAQNLGTRLVSLTSSVGLLLVDHRRCAGEGFWLAAADAIRLGGLLAVVCTSPDPLVHAALTTGVRERGWRYIQHIVATTSTELDTEVTASTTRPAIPGQVHRRAHRDVFLFSPIEDAGEVSR